MKKLANDKATAAASTFASTRTSRRIFSLAELHAALKPLEKDGVKPDSAIFNDLQSGALVTEVRFPAFRNGVITVPPDYWQEEEFDYFSDGRKYNFHGGKYNGEFYLTASIFADEERRKLRETNLAVWRGDLADSDSEYTAFFKSQGWVGSKGSILDREKLFEFCFRAQQELTTAEAKDIELQVWVRSPLLHDYLDQVRARLKPPDPKEKRTENRDAIYHEMIRRVIQDPHALVFGNRKRFVDDLWKWACEKYGTNNVAGADRIRQVVDEIIKPIETLLISNKR
jgi:hypothetical protein